MTQEKIREVVGIFDNKDDLDAAITELEAKAFPREMISVLGSKEAIEKQFGNPEVVPEQAEDNENTPRMPPIRPEEKALGIGALVSGGIATGVVATVVAAGAAVTVPAIITAAALGGGSGAVLAKILGDYFDDHTEKQIARGGLLLWVQTPGPKREALARAILVKYKARKVHTHDIA